jgi:hypothetical protein
MRLSIVKRIARQQSGVIMMHHGSYRRAATLLLLGILTSWLPSAATVPWSPDTPTVASAATAPLADSSQTRLTAPAVTDPHLPSLTIEIGLARTHRGGRYGGPDDYGQQWRA